MSEEEEELAAAQLAAANLNSPPSQGTLRPQPVPALLELAVASVIANINHVQDFGDLPEDICCGLFEVTLARGKLTEQLLGAFTATGHPRLLERVRQLNIRMVPPVLPTTRNGWLGDKPSLY